MNKNIPNYMAQAILATLFCCLPLGIVAIVHASSVSARLSVDDIEGARAASDSARTWSSIAAVTGILFGVAFFLVRAATS
ncbi:MAG: CD225/dispanin family protein [Myxococcales bacterium]|nr:CD225/dispanin family protein [Myxococcales bacterium]